MFTSVVDARATTTAIAMRSSGSAAVDQLDPVAVRIAHEAEERAALAHAIRLTLRVYALRRELLERRTQVVDGERDVPVAGAEVVRAPIVVVRQLEHGRLAADRVEVVRRLDCAVADDVHVALELEAEGFVERAAALGVGDPHHGVQELGHRREPTRGAPRRASRTGRRPATRRPSGTPSASRPRGRTRPAPRARERAR